ncbi:hypothetical protein PAN31108_04941 [Pandoraea anhela]|uniref:DUF1376 domain-containing protein n=1 Tax=Pandoraea anhela TaxID=2508295 RepID=A0A5E4Z369_9BURK|nr:hypothetical protein PAN31108_04941 [Pandoraea anhela]
MTRSTSLGTDRPSSNGAADVQPRHVFAVHVARPDPIQVSEMDSNAMSEYPTPMTPADCDLRNFREMPIDVPRLLRSDLAHDESPEACWSAVLLWCVAWHEVPAGSLPDNDEWLAKRTGYWHKGKLDETWNSVRDGALHGWVKCSDGRLYHPVVAEKVICSTCGWNAVPCRSRRRCEKPSAFSVSVTTCRNDRCRATSALRSRSATSRHRLWAIGSALVA